MLFVIPVRSELYLYTIVFSDNNLLFDFLWFVLFFYLHFIFSVYFKISLLCSISLVSCLVVISFFSFLTLNNRILLILYPQNFVHVEYLLWLNLVIFFSYGWKCLRTVKCYKTDYLTISPMKVNSYCSSNFIS